MRIRLLVCVILSGIWMLAPCSSAAQAAAGKRYVIADLGAVGDGKTMNTTAIQAAIDRCSAEGGGVIVVPKGTFMTGALFLKKGTNLEVEKDGVLKGSAEPSDYPQVNTRWEGTERLWTAALLNVNDLDGVEVTGAGTIDGSGDEWTRRAPARFGGQGGRGATQPATQTAAAPSTRPAATQRGMVGRPRMICFQNCKNVRITNLHLHNQAIWCLHILYSEDVLVDGLTIRADHNILSSDGMDIDSSRRVHVTHCDIDDDDDCISIKSGKDADGLRVNRPSEDILIENTRFGYGQGGVAMGSEVSGSIRRVEVKNCVFEDGNWAPIRFKSQPSRGGVVEDIVYRDLKLNGVRQVFDFNMAWRLQGGGAEPAKVPTVVRNVKIINVTGTAGSGGGITGLPDSPIQSVSFENCKVTVQRGLSINHARKLDLSGLNLIVSGGGEPIRKQDVE